MAAVTSSEVGRHLNTAKPTDRREKWSITFNIHQHTGQRCQIALGVRFVQNPLSSSTEIGVNASRRDLRGISTIIGRKERFCEGRYEPTWASFFDNRCQTPRKRLVRAYNERDAPVEKSFTQHA
jgi:hypothetical protein